ncbi:SPOR domain-containing protein [Variovorax sp. HJSM1_2]|uniref:SPOR domain-containing protein n=1 Tax=Variovorax sp. HJSM1_2 TaxID=3366263 RepID=UPI003BE2558D
MAFFKFRSRGQKGDDLSVSPTESIEGMRRRARHRLIGATILVLLGVIGFPLLFDTQPRPVSVDVPIDIPEKGKVKPLGAAATGPVVKLEQPPADATPSDTTPASNASSKANVSAAASLSAKEEVLSSSKPETRPEAKPEPKPEPKVEAKPEPKPKHEPEAKAVAKAEPKLDDSGARAKALLEGKSPSAATAAASSADDGQERFVVQVGAFAEASKAQEVRSKLEKAGLKTYTQVVQTSSGARTRVRVGPFAKKAEAEKAVAKIKGLDLSASVLTL